jgi:hypothetical protein
LIYEIDKNGQVYSSSELSFDAAIGLGKEPVSSDSIGFIARAVY